MWIAILNTSSISSLSKEEHSQFSPIRLAILPRVSGQVRGCAAIDSDDIYFQVAIPVCRKRNPESTRVDRRFQVLRRMIGNIRLRAACISHDKDIGVACPVTHECNDRSTYEAG